MMHFRTSKILRPITLSRVTKISRIDYVRLVRLLGVIARLDLFNGVALETDGYWDLLSLLFEEKRNTQTSQFCPAVRARLAGRRNADRV